jgi:hypothetical protein
MMEDEKRNHMHDLVTRAEALEAFDKMRKQAADVPEMSLEEINEEIRCAREDRDGMSESLAEELTFTEDELKELKIAKEKPIVFDEDCPETTPERAVRFRRVNPMREEFKKQDKIQLEND